MKVLVLGGDGFCGWPTALCLSASGMSVTIVDNLARRRIDAELGTASLTPIVSLEERLEAWRETGAPPIDWAEIDVAKDGEALSDLVGRVRPQAIVHFAEQRSAPYSMSSTEHRRYTVGNNVAANHNALCALVEHEVNAHFVHLGSIGVYGYETLGYRIPEGYLTVQRVEPDDQIGPPEEMLHPFNPVSIYHMTKAMDHLAIAFYAHHHGIRATDLHQGIVWGVQTEETARDPRLINRFDYDVDFGTVVNRFIVQAALGHPLSVYGSGRQTRSFIHVGDMVKCIEAALANPPPPGSRVRVVNQIAESRRIVDLAREISSATGARIIHVQNPRDEPQENEFDAINDGVLDLGVAPTAVEARLIHDIADVARTFRDRIDSHKLYPQGAPVPIVSGDAA